MALRAWSALRLSPPFTAKPCCLTLLLMRAGGMFQAFSFCLSLSLSFSLSLSIPLLHCSQACSVKYLLSYFILPACHQFQAVLLSFTMCHTIHDIRMHTGCQMYTFTHRTRRKEERMNPSHVPTLPPWKHTASSKHIYASFDSISCTIKL